MPTRGLILGKPLSLSNSGDEIEFKISIILDSSSLYVKLDGAAPSYIGNIWSVFFER